MMSPLDVHLKYLVVFLLIVAFEPFYREPMFEYSLEWIRESQAKRSAIATQVFVILSKIGDGDLYLAIFLVYYVCGNIAKALYIMTYICAGSFLLTVTKMIYMEPRPYFVDDQITCLDKCSAEYGNPSGHSVIAGYFLMLCLDYFHDKPQSVLKKICFVFAASIKLLIGYSRLYVGAHSLNQIVYGLLLGLWFTLYFHYCFRQPLQAHVNHLLSAPAESLNYKRYFLTSTSIIVAIQGVQIITYYIMSLQFHHELEWERRIFQKCPNVKPNTGQLFNDNSIIFCSISTASYAGYLGLMAYRHFLGPYWPNMNNVSFVKAFLKILVLEVLCYPVRSEMRQKYAHSIPYLIALHHVLHLANSFIIYGVAPYFFQLLGLVNTDQKP